MVCEGNPATSEEAFSGTAKRMFLALQAAGHEMIPVDASLPPVWRAVAAVLTYSPDRSRWRANFRYSNRTCRLRARAAQQSLGKVKADVILQIGATFDPPLRHHVAPYAIFCDWNMELHAREPAGPGGLRSGLSPADLDSIRPEHRRRYEAAGAVITISERLRQSFLEDYSLSAAAVHTAYAGPNFDEALIVQATALPRQNSTPTVLFVAKEFTRKGGSTVAAAFRRVRVTVPAARLLYAGAAELPSELANLDGVESLGLLDKTRPADLRRLLSAYREADLMVLPSRRDPFPTVIREAMSFSLPCIVSDIWAMPEMVIDRETGFLVPPDDVELLAQRMELLLTDAALREKFGHAARARAEALFTWGAVGRKLEHVLDAIAHPVN